MTPPMENKKTLLFGVVFWVAGFVFLILENIFYQYVSDDGILHESLFFPLGTISLFLGWVVFVFFGNQTFISGNYASVSSPFPLYERGKGREWDFICKGRLLLMLLLLKYRKTHQGNSDCVTNNL